METPKWLQEKLTEIGGKNPHGEPNFRVIWGRSRLAWHGGEMTERDASGNVIRKTVTCRLEPAYPEFLDRWLFECWLPPEAFGTEEDWEQNTVVWLEGQRVETLGPFPRRGDYDLCMVLQTPLKGKCAKQGGCSCGDCLSFIPLTETAAMGILKAAMATRDIPLQLRQIARREDEQKKSQAEEARVFDELEEKRPAFSGPHVTVQ